MCQVIMVPEKGSRVDTSELKAMMLNKIGAERFKRYFYCLNRFINQKMNKRDFDRSCIRILGRDTLPLHNQIIKSILKNACNAKVPPQIPQSGPTNPSIAAGRSSNVREDGHGPSSFLIQNQAPAIRSNGVALPASPRKVRSCIRDRMMKDRPSPLGPNGKTDSASHHSTATEDSGGAKTVENGHFIPSDCQRSIQYTQGLAEQPDSVMKLRIKKSSDIPGATLFKDKTNEAIAVEDGEEVEQATHLNSSKNPLLAPLGIPFCSASIGGARKLTPVAIAHNFSSCLDSGYLPDTETLSRRMEQIAASQGLHGGVTMECTKYMNSMLDVYLMRLIKSCVDMVGENPSRESMKHAAPRHQIQDNQINGLRPSYHLRVPSGGVGLMERQRSASNQSVSLLDFKVAMELSPGQLGENWPLLMEKISMQIFEEGESLDNLWR